MAIDENGGQFDVTKYCTFTLKDNENGTAVVTVTYKQGSQELSTTYTVTYEVKFKKDNTALIVGLSVGGGVLVIGGAAAGLIIKSKKTGGKKHEKGE